MRQLYVRRRAVQAPDAWPRQAGVSSRPRAAKMLGRSAKDWPIREGPAEWLRKWAQSVAERRHAAARRLTELSEDKLRKAMAFSGSAE